MNPRLVLTDGETTINLLGWPFMLRDWTPQIAPYKDGGIHRESPLVSGRQLIDAKYENVIETIGLVVRAGGQNQAIEAMQDIRRLLKKSEAYWMNRWQVGGMVWLEARAANETNTRYAIIHQGQIAQDSAVFSQPFAYHSGPCTSIMDNISLVIERGHWLETPPGTGTQIVVAGDQYLAVANWLTNPSFETNTTVWSTDNLTDIGTRISGDSVFGDWSVEVERASGAGDLQYSFLVTPIGLLPQRPFVASAYLRRISLAGNTPINVVFRWIGGVNPNASTVILLGTVDEVLGDGTYWKRVQVSATPDFADRTSIRVYFRFLSTGPVGEKFRIDAAMLATREIEYFDGDQEGALWNSTPHASISVKLIYEPSLTEKVFVANKSFYDNITHMYHQNKIGLWSENLINTMVGEPTIIEMDTTTSAVYFGIASLPETQPNEPQFSSVALKVSENSDNVGGLIVWEYYNNASSAWVALPKVRDNTNHFTITGTNVVSWQQPGNVWIPKILSAIVGSGPSVSAFWVRARPLVTGTGLVKIVNPIDYRPHTINTPYVQISGDDILGDVTALAKVLANNQSAVGGEDDEIYVPVTASTDEAYVDIAAGTIHKNDDHLKIGIEYSAGIRFPSVSIPKNASIKSAYLVFTARETYGEDNDPDKNIYVTISAQDSETPSNFGSDSAAQFLARPRTDQSVKWNITNPWFIADTYISPNISVIVEEMINRSGWTGTGTNSLVFFLDDFISSSLGVRKFRNLVFGGGHQARLVVSYHDQDSFTTRMWVGGRSMSRGSRFNAYLNLAGVQNEPDTSVEFLDDISLGPIGPIFGDSVHGEGVPTVWAPLMVHDTSFSTTLVKPRIIFRLHDDLPGQYVGRYHAFLRMQTLIRNFSFGTGGNVPQFGINTNLGISVAGGPLSVSRDTRAVVPLLISNDSFVANRVVVSLGEIEIGSTYGGTDITEFVVRAGTETISGFGDVKIQFTEIILIPVDETFIDVRNDNATVDSIGTIGTTIHLDSISVPKKTATAELTRNGVVRGEWTPITTGEFVCQPNQDQRFWFLAARQHTLASFVSARQGFFVDNPRTLMHAVSDFQTIHEVKQYKQSRYLSGRGRR